MSKYASHSGSFLTAVLVLLCAFWMSPVTSAQADEYQDAIAQAFPASQILDGSEFDQEIQKGVSDSPLLGACGE